MAKSSFNIGNMVQEVHIDPINVFGYGSKLNPALRVPFVLDVHLPNEYIAFWFQSLKASFFIDGESYQVSDSLLMMNHFVPYNNSLQYNIEFPLSQAVLEHIEKKRHGDLIGRIEITFNTSVLDKIASLGNLPIFRSFTNDRAVVNLEIPQSHWVKNVLPKLFYKSFRLVELCTAQELIGDDFKKCLIELGEAEKYFISGDYDKCVAHCRTAIDPIIRDLKKLEPAIKSSHKFEWYDKVARITSHFASSPHHQPSTGHFNRDEAETVYLIVVGIIKYASILQ